MSPKSLESQLEHMPERRWGSPFVQTPISQGHQAWSVFLTFIATWLLVMIPSASGAEPLSSVSKLSSTERGDVTIIRVVTSTKPVASVHKLEQLSRLTLDFPRSKFEGVESLIEINSWAVSQVATTQMLTDATTTARIMIDLRRPSRYQIRTENNAFVIIVTPLQARPRGLTGGALRASRYLIKDIRFVDRKDKAAVEILSEGRATHLLRQDGNDLVLEMQGVTLPKLLQRTLDASEFGGPIERITSLVQDAKTGKVAIRVALRQLQSQNEARWEGQKLIWEFSKAKVAKAAAGSVSPPTAQPADSYTYTPLQVAAARTKRGPGRGGQRQFSGRRIDLDFKDADIHNILRLLSDVGNVNVITSDNVQGKVTIRMKDVPWDQALDVILRAKGFGMVREGNLLRVAPAADLEKEREAEIARMKQMVQLKPLETRLIPLSYAQASGILPKLQYTLSPRGKLTFDDRTNMVIARDIASNLDLMERLIRNLDTQTPQVLIEARIIEARTSFSKEIGIQWGGNFVSSQGTGNPTGLVFPNQIGIGGGNDDSGTPTGGILLGQAANPNFLVNMPAATGLNSGAAMGMTLGSVSGAVNINLRLSAAESTGDARVVSAPKVTTLDNVTATIEQGVTIPYSQVSAAGVQTTFRDARLSLTVKPHVTADGSIIMQVQVSRNEPDFANTGPRGDPTILRKEAKTQMLVKDGDTAVIGGIYTTRTARSLVKVPWFAELPILGFFFKHRKDTSDREEVLVFITPRIINRAQSILRGM
jgi:type IV pilus assembly protein PilQ